MTEKVNVKSALGQRPDESFPVALFERSDEHEGGEVFIADNKIHNVALTGAVQAALASGALVRAEKGERAGDEFDAEIKSGSRLELLEGDTVESLTKRFSAGELNQLAEHLGVDTSELKNKTEVATAILDAS